MGTLTANVSSTVTRWPLSAALAASTRFLLVDDELVAVITPGVRESQREDPTLSVEVERGVAGEQASHTSGTTYTELSSPPLAADGGEQIVYQQTVTLTDAQVKALPTTPVVLIPATEVIDYSGLPDSLPRVVDVVVFAKNTTAYTNIDATGEWQVAWGSDNSATILKQEESVASGLEQGTKYFRAPTSFSGTVSADKIFPQTQRLDDALYDNAVILRFHNAAAGNLTGGNAANKLRVTVTYTLVELSDL